MGWLALVGALFASQPMNHWLESAREEFKIPELKVVVEADGVLLQVESLEQLDAQTHDHLIASFLATLGPELMSPNRPLLRVVDPDFVAWEHEPFKLGELASLESRQSEGSPLRRGRYRSGALAGVHLGLSAGHGIMWDDGVWRYQRSELFELREDLHTNHIMGGLVAPLLERMGATLTFVRGAGFDRTRIQLDDSSDGPYTEMGSWSDGSSTGGWLDGYRVAASSSIETSVASWAWLPESSGEFPVYIWYVSGSNRSTQTTVRVKSGEHVETLYLDQTKRGSRWVYLGTFSFEKGQPASVEVSNLGEDPSRYVVADAVWVGGGVGTVDFGGGVSGKDFWQQSAQAQSREFSLPSSVSNPYGDVTVRPAWAIWDDVDLYVSLHTNAGGGRGTSTFVYSNQVAYPSFDPNRSEELQPGSLELQDAIHARMIESVRRYWDPDWRDRGKWGANFGELRPLTLAWREDADISIPAMLIELAFHDSEDDTYYLREQRFRSDMARAIVRGILDFVYRNADVVPSMTPEPPADLSITGEAGARTLKWRSAIDPIDLESNARSYRVERSRDGKAYFPYATTEETSLTISDSEACASNVWRVIALNESGESLPSESVVDVPVFGVGPRILWVDGHRRWVQTVNEAPSRPRPAARVLEGLTQLAEEGVGVDSARSEVIASGELNLEAYALVIWSVGETSTVDQSLTGAEREAIERYLESGGTLVLSGSEIAWHLGRSFDSDEASFFEEVLGASYVSDSSTSYDLTWALGDDAEAVEMTLDDGSGLYQRVGYPDVVESLVGGVIIAEYGDNGEVAALWQEALNGNLFYLAFPLEAVRDDADRVQILGDMMASVLSNDAQNGIACLEGETPEDAPAEPFDPVEVEVTEVISAELAPSDEPELESKADDSGCGGCQGNRDSVPWVILLIGWFLHRIVRRQTASQA